MDPTRNPMLPRTFPAYLSFSIIIEKYKYKVNQGHSL